MKYVKAMAIGLVLIFCACIFCFGVLAGYVFFSIIYGDIIKGHYIDEDDEHEREA